ncbi:hypothetical protein [Noviherbaspirillum sp.]|jgi:hypothetical protein|uniref:hypothetical protein n=1 Tax=Noviherbaspirillum sp. TaxID=1926288 RepID=UPI0025CCE909|nr:hypothetical protein [Noviherbaspirillum sp.]
MSLLTSVTNYTLIGPYENQVSIYHANGLVWATIEQWCSALKAPYFLPDMLRNSVEAQAALLKGGPYTAMMGTSKVYRWPPIAAALDLWHRNWMVRVSKGEHTTMPTSLRNESEQFARNVSKLKAWGYELQERELQAAINSKGSVQTSSSVPMDVAHAMQAIRTLAQATQAVLEKHESEILEHGEQLDQIKREMPAFRSPDEFVTIKQRCIERALAFGKIVQGRMNLTQACGQYLQKSGAEKGPLQAERLDGSAIITEVATWQRKDIDAAIKHYMPELAAPN